MISNKMRYRLILIGVALVTMMVTVLVKVNFTERKSLSTILAEEYSDNGEVILNSINMEVASYIVQYGYMTESWTVLEEPVCKEDSVDLVCVLDDDTELCVSYTISTGECDISEK